MPTPDVLVALLDACAAASTLDPAARSALATILTGPLAYSFATPLGDRHLHAHFAEVLKRCHVAPAEARRYLAGLGPDDGVLDALAALEDAGWIVSWPLDGAIAVTLSPWGEERLRVELVERGDGGEGVWAPIDPTPRPIYLGPEHRRVSTWDTEWLDALASDLPSPVDEAIMAEEFLLQEARTEDGRLAADEATGKPVKTPVTLWGKRIKVDPRLARRRPGGIEELRGQRLKVDPRLARRRPGPRRKVEART